MNNTSNVVPQLLNYDYIGYIAAFFGLILILFINRGRLIAYWMDVKTRRCLNNLGLEQIHNVKCPDGLGHEFNIDRLVLRQNGISILMQKKYPGKIFCADHIDHWTQMLGQKSYNFKNPLFELDYQIKALEACLPDVDINGYLFFDHNAEFPKGHPQRVIHPVAIPADLEKPHAHEVNQQLLQTWNNFRAKAQNL